MKPTFKSKRNVTTHSDNDKSVSDVAFGNKNTEATSDATKRKGIYGTSVGQEAAKAHNPKSNAKHFKKGVKGYSGGGV